MLRLELFVGIVIGCVLSSLTSRWSEFAEIGRFCEATHSQLLPPEEPAIPRQRLLCWVVTVPHQHQRAHNIKETWGRRCDTLLFISSEADDSLPTVVVPLQQESRRLLWRKAAWTLRHVYRHYIDDHDWFFKADDDTYALIDNLRTHLATLNASQPLFVGHQFAYGFETNVTFLSGGAGYVLSREAMRRLVERGLEQDLCPYRSFTGEEDDVVITECLKKLGAAIPDTRDAFDNHRFLSCNVLQCLEHKVGPYDCQSRDQRRNCLSRRPFAFHYVKDTDMLVYEYLLYEAKTVESNFEGPCW